MADPNTQPTDKEEARRLADLLQNKSLTTSSPQLPELAAENLLDLTPEDIEQLLATRRAIKKMVLTREEANNAILDLANTFAHTRVKGQNLPPAAQTALEKALQQRFISFIEHSNVLIDQMDAVLIREAVAPEPRILPVKDVTPNEDSIPRYRRPPPPPTLILVTLAWVLFAWFTFSAGELRAFCLIVPLLITGIWLFQAWGVVLEWL